MILNQLADAFGPAMLWGFGLMALACLGWFLVQSGLWLYRRVRRAIRGYRVRRMLREMQSGRPSGVAATRQRAS